MDKGILIIVFFFIAVFGHLLTILWLYFVKGYVISNNWYSWIKERKLYYFYKRDKYPRFSQLQLLVSVIIDIILLAIGFYIFFNEVMRV